MRATIHGLIMGAIWYGVAIYFMPENRWPLFFTIATVGCIDAATAYLFGIFGDHT